jgi:hypothetical protein
MKVAKRVVKSVERMAYLMADLKAVLRDYLLADL